MDLSLGLLKIVFGVSCLAGKIGTFIGIVVDGRPSALLHGNIRTHCFLVMDRLRKLVVAFQEPLNSILSRLSCWSRQFLIGIYIDIDDGVRVERGCKWWRFAQVADH